MKSEVITFSYDNGELQRVQTVRMENWESLDFFDLPGNTKALDCFAEIYRKYLIPACPWIFGNLILFSLPEDLQIALPMETEKSGIVSDPLTAAAALLQNGVNYVGKHPVFRDSRGEKLFRELKSRGCIRIVRGKLPTIRFLPVANTAGFLTDTEPAGMKVNASFFIMDPFDCASVYDHIGTPFGLCIKNGKVLRPPLFGREALLVKKDGSVTVRPVELGQQEIHIRGRSYRIGGNAVLYTRPERSRTPAISGTKLVIVGTRVAAVCRKKRVTIPASGFVLCVEDADDICPGDMVCYSGMEDVAFGIQVGNSILVNGEKTVTFQSDFYNIRHFQPVPFPPSLYPMNFRKDRAARIALGADKEGKPMLLWAEGAPKQGYIPGKDSCGASLTEMAEICAVVGMVNAVNLDGGGSAQILLNNKRHLLISDRKGTEETERPVPLGLIIQ